MSSHQIKNEFVEMRLAEAALKLLVIGFNPSEQEMLDAVVRFSQRRQPRLELLGIHDQADADVVMIDAADSRVVSWACNQPWLAHKVVIWVDAHANTNIGGGIVVKRPIQWPVLPMLLARALEHVPKGTEAVPATTSRCNSVLVVDDSLAVRAQLRSLLESRGLIVTEAENAEAALNFAATSPYACILMDVLMPGIDGYEACRLIKANAHGGKKANVVMLTSRTSPFDRIRGKMAGCDAYLAKPVDPDQLHEVISRYLAKPADNGRMTQPAYI